MRVFTIGLGSGCDHTLCQDTADAGRGTCSIVEDRAKDLNSQVIKALRNATQISMKACKIEWPQIGITSDLKEVFRNTSIIST